MQNEKSYTLHQLAELIGAQACGDAKRIITGLAELNTNDPAKLTFLDSVKKAEGLPENIAIVADITNFPQGHDGLCVKSFRGAMGLLLALFEPCYESSAGISPAAFVDSSATVHPSAFVGPNCTVCAGAQIGRGARLIANVYVGPDAEVGEDSVLEPMVVLQRRTKIGARCLIHSCAVLGADGFGIIPGGPDGKNVKIPQIGRVVIGNDVEIGAGTCIDRATISETVVADGTKMDNQIQIGHNCRLGRNCIIASQTGVAGSTTIEDGVVAGARSGINGHITVARGTQIAGLGIVRKSTRPGQLLSGDPAMDFKEDFRLRAALRRVPQMQKRLKELERILQHASTDAEK